jgi:hypothetical protein
VGEWRGRRGGMSICTVAHCLRSDPGGEIVVTGEEVATSGYHQSLRATVGVHGADREGRSEHALTPRSSSIGSAVHPSSEGRE